MLDDNRDRGPTAAPSVTPEVHVPVLLDEVLRWLEPRPGAAYVDCTVGAGGHAAGVLARSSPSGRLLGIDADPVALSEADRRLGYYTGRFALVNSNYVELERLARWHGFAPADGILFDLGVSSLQLERSERGFSFRSDAPLDMRFDPRAGVTAADLVGTLGERELSDILFRFGEEPAARTIARAIVAERCRHPIETTMHLASVVEKVARKGYQRVHPATRTFQALRIAVNRELEGLVQALPQALEVLAPGGRLVAISFHSLEDRIVKTFFAEQAKGCICPPGMPVCACGHAPALRVLTRKPITPTDDEIRRNPRSRSAKLRAARRL